MYPRKQARSFTTAGYAMTAETAKGAGGDLRKPGVTAKSELAVRNFFAIRRLIFSMAFVSLSSFLSGCHSCRFFILRGYLGD